MKVRILVRVSMDEAARLAAGLTPDNDGLVRTMATGSGLEIVAEGAALSVLRSLDDVLGCLRGAGVE